MGAPATDHSRVEVESGDLLGNQLLTRVEHDQRHRVTVRRLDAVTTFTISSKHTLEEALQFMVLGLPEVAGFRDGGLDANVL